jgi:hypothetical protein
MMRPLDYCFVFWTSSHCHESMAQADCQYLFRLNDYLSGLFGYAADVVF